MAGLGAHQILNNPIHYSDVALPLLKEKLMNKKVVGSLSTIIARVDINIQMIQSKQHCGASTNANSVLKQDYKGLNRIDDGHTKFDIRQHFHNEILTGKQRFH